jgi:hypothetical protein
VKPIIFGHLSLWDVARAAISCREFRDAYRLLLAEGRQKLMGLAEKNYGKPMLNTLVVVMRQGIRDLDRSGTLIGGDGPTLRYVTEEGELLAHQPENRPPGRPMADFDLRGRQSTGKGYSQGGPACFTQLSACIFQFRQRGSMSVIDFLIRKGKRGDDREVLIWLLM